jgi:hypothetical protein
MFYTQELGWQHRSKCEEWGEEREGERLLYPHRNDAMAAKGSKAALWIDVGLLHDSPEDENS